MELRRAPQNIKHNNFESKICQYADFRVSPFGVTTLDARLREVQSRFMKNKGISKKEFDNHSSSMRTIEKRIFEQCKIKPEDVTESNIRGLIKKVRSFEIKKYV